jgi:chemotaxis protein CheX
VRVQIVNCYVAAASQVLVQETGEQVKRGGLELKGNPYITEAVTAMIGVSGDLAGSLYLSMTESTARELVSKMLGQPTAQMDDLAQSGIAELANVVAGNAGIALSAQGHRTDITPPFLIVGAGARLSHVEIQRLVVPLTTTCGTVNVHVALREAT